MHALSLYLRQGATHLHLSQSRILYMTTLGANFTGSLSRVSSTKPTTMSAHHSDLVTETLGPSDKKCEEKLLTNTEPELAATSQPFVVGTDLTLRDFVLPRELRFDTPYDEFVDEDCGSFPVIDLQRNFATTHGDRSSSTSSQLAHAVATWGFFKVINHRVPPEIFEKNLANARSLFGKEVGEKRGIVGQAGTYLGYHEGTSLGAHSSWHENVGFPRSPEMLREMVRHMWPGDPVRAEELRHDITEHLEYMEELSMHLLELLEEGLGLQPKSISRHYNRQESPSVLKFNHYPVCQRPDLAQGFPPHTDASTMAILHQEVGGLQVLKDSEWLSIRPEPGSLIVNIGDTLQAWSNGKYQSVQHRVALNSTSARISQVYFLNPHDNTLIAPIPELVDASHPTKYRPFTWAEYRSFIAPNLKAAEPAKRLDIVALVG